MSRTQALTTSTALQVKITSAGQSRCTLPVCPNFWLPVSSEDIPACEFLHVCWQMSVLAEGLITPSETLDAKPSSMKHTLRRAIPGTLYYFVSLCQEQARRT